MSKRLTIKREVPVRLNEADIVAIRTEVANLSVERRTLVREFNLKAQEHKLGRKKLQKEIDDLLDSLEAGEVTRLLEVREVLDPEARTVDVIRVDTDTVVMTRPARPEEMQIGIPFEATDEEAPEEFAKGNVVYVANVPSAKGAIYQVTEIRQANGNPLADLELVIKGDAARPPEILQGIATAYLEAAIFGGSLSEEADPPAESEPIEEVDEAPPAPKKRGRPKKAA